MDRGLDTGLDPLSELRAAFLEECDELLGDLEARLSSLRDGSAAADDVNAAFRAIHSVKGGAGAFGLPSLVELAHVFEAALDHLRAGRMGLGSAPYGLFFRALDHVASMVAGARDGAPAAPAPPELVAELKRVGVADAADPAQPPQGQGHGQGQEQARQQAQNGAAATTPRTGQANSTSCSRPTAISSAAPSTCAISSQASRPSARSPSPPHSTLSRLSTP